VKTGKESRSMYIEGEATYVPCQGDVKDVLAEIMAGVRSGMSYSGARNLKELRENAEFMEVSGNTLRENGAHGKVD